jgi:hypothetical protein
VKKISIILIAALVLSKAGWAQLYIHGTVREGAAPNKVDILFNSDYTSAVGEFVNFVQFAISVPITGNADLAPTVTPVGNFTGMAFQIATPYDFNGERIYRWTCVNSSVTTMSWTAGTPFVGATVTFVSGGAPSKVRMLDLSIAGGDGSTFFALATTKPGNDPTDYGVFFYAGTDVGNTSTIGTYPSGDRFVETDLLISLPVNLINFSGYKNGGKNTLNWTVASEVSNRGFDVQRSTDGVNYSSIGFVNSQVGGYSNSEVHYTFDDNSLVGKKQYYRLNQKDIDGNSKLSNIVVITRDKPTELSIGGIFPNPASTQVNVIIDAPQRDKVTLVVTDMAGKTVIQQQANIDLGSNTIPVNIAKLAGGSYLIKLTCQTSGCQTATAKFNKL